MLKEGLRKKLTRKLRSRNRVKKTSSIDFTDHDFRT